MKKSSVLAGLFVFLIVTSSLSFVSAGVNQAVIRVVPAQINWMANGVTQYRVDVIADNRPLFPERTYGVDWKLVAPEGLVGNLSPPFNATLPSAPQDFFVGSTLLENHISSGWANQWRSVQPAGFVPSNKSGVLASYWFTVSPGAVYGQYAFGIDLANTAFYGVNNLGNLTEQLFTVESIPFKVVKPAYPLATYSRAQQCIPGVNC